MINVSETQTRMTASYPDGSCFHRKRKNITESVTDTFTKITTHINENTFSVFSMYLVEERRFISKGSKTSESDGDCFFLLETVLKPERLKAVVCIYAKN